MKKTLYLLMGILSLMTYSQAASIIATLPESKKLSQSSTDFNGMAPNGGQDLLNKVKTWDYGIYAGGNNNSLGNWGTNSEGQWTNTNNLGSITLAGRSGVAGDSFAMVLAGPSTGTILSNITFSCSTPTSVISNYTMVLGVYDTNGALVSDLSTTQAFTFNSTSTTTSISLDLSSSNLEWKEGYKLVAGVRGGAGSATSPYTINDIKVSYDVAPIPEPTSATLGLLGLGGLLLRRKRQTAN